MPGVVALLTLGAFLWCLPAWRADWAWFSRGRVDRRIGALIGAFGVISGAALLLWYVTLRPTSPTSVRRCCLPTRLDAHLGGVGFSMVNAAVEESLFRGLLLEALDHSFASGWAAVLMQAAAFGVLHLHGFPRGAVGVGLAAVYGLMMGVLRPTVGRNARPLDWPRGHGRHYRQHPDPVAVRAASLTGEHTTSGLEHTLADPQTA